MAADPKWTPPDRTRPTGSETPPLSLTIPLYDEEGNVARVVQALLDTFRKAEVPLTLILVDNGSRDGTRAIVQRLEREEPEVRGVYLDKNQGYGGGILAGMETAESPLLGYMWGDGQVGADDVIRWETVAIEPPALDAESLGLIGKRVIIDLAVRFRPDVLVLDAPVPPKQIPRYRDELYERLEAAGVMGIEIVAENGADDTYMCCAAASIFAKTTRDARLRGIEDEVGIALGSGYPGDPKTTDFLRGHWTRERSWPSFVRTKWDTCRRIVAETAQGQLFS